MNKIISIEDFIKYQNSTKSNGYIDPMINDYFKTINNYRDINDDYEDNNSLYKLLEKINKESEEESETTFNPIELLENIKINSQNFNYNTPSPTKTATSTRRGPALKTGIIGTTNLKQCAEWANGIIRSLGFNNVRGDAWNISGIKPVINGFEGLDASLINNNDIEQIKQYIKRAQDNFKLLYNEGKLDKSKVYIAHMRQDGSRYQLEAFNNGLNFSKVTHEGIMKYINGNWYVEHNANGNIYRELASNLLNSNKKYGIVSISEAI